MEVFLLLRTPNTGRWKPSMFIILSAPRTTTADNSREGPRAGGINNEDLESEPSPVTDTNKLWTPSFNGDICAAQ